MGRNPNALPTTWELRCAGMSLLIASVILIVGISIGSASTDRSVYKIRSKQDIIAFHKELTKPEIRLETEIFAGLIWLTFPFYLFAIGGITKIFKYVCHNSKVSLIVYSLEKGYLIWLIIFAIIQPSIHLVAISIDWNFDDTSTITTDNIPASYYIQLYVLLLGFELFDAAAVAEAVFLLSMFIMARWSSYKAIQGDRRFRGVLEVANPLKCMKTNTAMKCMLIVTSVLGIIFLIIFIVVIFEFADNGLFAPDSPLKGLLILDILMKVILGIDMAFNFSRPVVLNKVKAMFSNIEDTGFVELEEAHATPNKNDTITR